MLYQKVNMLLQCFFPGRCPVCEQLVSPYSDGMHPQCRKKLLPVEEPVCLKCGRPIYSERKEYCGQCEARMPAFTQGKALYVYAGGVKVSMYRLKYSNRREYAAFYAAEAVKRYSGWLRQCRIDVILPVPMYRPKERVRGYNQAALLAASLSRRCGIPWSDRVIRRSRNTRALKLYNEKQRREALKGAFAVDGELLAGKGWKRILLVDDIFTTGSTMEEITGVLEKCGTEAVFVFTICTSRGI